MNAVLYFGSIIVSECRLDGDATLWSGTLLVTLTFLSLVKVLALWGTFAIYGALSFLCLIYVWRMVPETKGRTLEQIQHAWSK